LQNKQTHWAGYFSGIADVFGLLEEGPGKWLTAVSINSAD